MVVAGCRHLTSRNQDPQLHTHCVIANMTRNEKGVWRSLETTKLRRSEKLIGAYYRNALARRLQALGYAITPTMVGRAPGFEIAGYGRALLDAFSSRRFEILNALAANGLPYTDDHGTLVNVDVRIGWRITSVVPDDPGFELSLDATRSEPANVPEHGVMLRVAIRR